MASRRRSWFLIRVAIYVAIVIGLYLWRGGVDWQRFVDLLKNPAESSGNLRVAGRDLAPDLVDRLLESYRRDYPDLNVRTTGGGTNQALEDLLNGRTDVAFLYRTPSESEQELFRNVTGDTAIFVPVAVGAVVLLAGVGTDFGDVSVGEVRSLLNGDPSPRCQRIYVPDPNEGLWTAACRWLGKNDMEPVPEAGVVFLADERAVVAAVADDPLSWGMISTFAIPTDEKGLPLTGSAPIPLASTPTAVPALPTYANLASGAYPLFHRLYIACRGQGGIEAAKFVTHLASARGLRQVERAGMVPAKQVLREIHVTRDPVGE
jgi:ABC-type phosphate transport system substrate-binding protein